MCENNSTCIEDASSFKCVCSKGFLGRRCNIQACDYKPCHSYSVCVSLAVENATKNDFRCLWHCQVLTECKRFFFRCICPEGFTGTNCSEKIDYCSSTPCLNGGQCINEESAYKCYCKQLFFGSNCEFRRETNYILNFTRYDVNDFIRLKGFQTDLTEVSGFF